MDVEETRAHKRSSIEAILNKKSLNDYEWLYSLGRGSYGEVYYGKQKATDQEVAIKGIDKEFIRREKKCYQIFVEKEMLFNLDHQGIVKMKDAFQTNEKYYFIMEYLSGGDLAEMIHLNQKNISYKEIQFYMAEIVVILEYLHSQGIAHRDLKLAQPQNILLTEDKHLKLVDFGTAYFFNESLFNHDIVQRINQFKSKYTEDLISQRKSRATFVGTAEYISPELLIENKVDNACDLWALGCILNKFFTGRTPFYANTDYLIYEKIQRNQFELNKKIPKEAQDLIRQLLIKDRVERIQANSFQNLKQHPFFNGINFDNLFQQDPPNKIKSFKVDSFQSTLCTTPKIIKKNKQKCRN